MFERHLVAGWGDMDFNAHMRNTAFLDRSADVRMMFFAEQGFPMEEFLRLQIGPVIRKDEIEYFRQIRLFEAVTSAGGWLDLSLRKLTAPPPALLAALRSLSETSDFQPLPSSIKPAGG